MNDMNSVKTALLKGALESFCLKGYDGVGVQELADLGRVTKPTLYHYFGNKEGILKTVLEFYFTPFLSELSDLAGAQKDLPLILEDLGFLFLKSSEREPSFWRFMLSINFSPSDSVPYRCVQAHLEKQFRILETLFKREVRRYGNMKGKEHLIAVSFIGLMHTHVSLVLNWHTRVSDKLVWNVVHQFLYGIFT